MAYILLFHTKNFDKEIHISALMNTSGKLIYHT